MGPMVAAPEGMRNLYCHITPGDMRHPETVSLTCQLQNWYSLRVKSMKIQYALGGGGEFQGVVQPALPKPVPFGEAYVPESFTAVLTAADLPGVVTVQVRVDAKRGPIIEEFTLTARKGRSISPEDLHRVPLAKVRDAVMAQVPTFRLLVNEQGEVFGAAGKPPGSAPVAIRAEMRRHGWQPLDDEHLRKVASVYRAAERHPTKAVAERFGVPRPTAGRWVMAARARGLLEPATQRHVATVNEEEGST